MSTFIIPHGTEEIRFVDRDGRVTGVIKDNLRWDWGQEYCLPFATNTPQLRALRLWHWSRAISARKSAEKTRNGTTRFAKKQTQQCDGRANFHIRAVQALNDVVNGTAEIDAARDTTFPKSEPFYVLTREQLIHLAEGKLEELHWSAEERVDAWLKGGAK